MKKEKFKTEHSGERREFIKNAAMLAAGIGAAGAGLNEVLADEVKNTKEGKMEVAIYLYDQMTVLDAIGPYEVLRCMPNTNVRFVAKKAGPIRVDSGIQLLNADYTIADITTADILVVPGGNAVAQLGDKAVTGWVRAMHEKTKWTASVCTGSLILGAAGLLKGLQATTHWNALNFLKMFEAEPVKKRFVRQGKLITAAGVSAGIDMALMLVSLERGEDLAQTIQLGIEYDPQPPFNAGSVDKASPSVIDQSKKMLSELYSVKKQ
jgi:transcriptional regulator GlxA family with amidase domain